MGGAWVDGSGAFGLRRWDQEKGPTAAMSEGMDSDDKGRVSGFALPYSLRFCP